MKTKIRHLSNYFISAKPDLKLAQANPSRTHECPNVDECLGIVPRSTTALHCSKYTECPKIKLALGYLTIVSTSDSQNYLKGPNRF